MSHLLQAAARVVRRWSSMLAIALVLVHAAPALACASSGAASGCCGDCDPNTCILMLQAAVSDSQPACSMAPAGVHAPVANTPSNGCGPDYENLTSRLAALGEANAAPYPSSRAPQFQSAPRLYLLLRQLRL